MFDNSCIEVEFAMTHEERVKGLMNRTRLNNAEKIGKDCNNSFVLAISEIDMDLARYPNTYIIV